MSKAEGKMFLVAGGGRKKQSPKRWSRLDKKDGQST